MAMSLRTAGKTRAESILAKPHLELEEALAAVDALEVLREHEGQDGHELHEDVEGGPRRVLEGVADRVARDGRVVRRRRVAVAVLLSESWVRVEASRNVLLRVVPRAARVRHADSQLNT